MCLYLLGFSSSSPLPSHLLRLSTVLPRPSNTLLQIRIDIHSVANSRTLQQHTRKLTFNILDAFQLRPFHKQSARLLHKHDFGTQSIRLNFTMSTATANDSDDDFRTRGQQPVLASQRAKQNNTPTEANRTGKVGGYFPLGYKDAISQWVRNPSPFTLSGLTPLSVGKRPSRYSRAPGLILHPLPQETPYADSDWDKAAHGNACSVHRASY